MPNQETQTNETTEQMLIESMNDMKLENDKLSKELKKYKRIEQTMISLDLIMDDIQDVNCESDEGSDNAFIPLDIFYMIKRLISNVL